MQLRSVVAVLAVVALLFGGHAQARADDGPAPVMFPPPVLDPPKRGVYWHDEWPRFTVLEAMLSAAVTFRNNDLGAHLDGPNSATIVGEVPVLDHGARDLFMAGSANRRKAAARLSDIGFRTMALAPYVFDIGIGALAVHQNADVAAQLALIDFEVLTFAGMTQLLGSRVIGRARPYVHDCPPGGCTGGPYRSFLSGHSMASFTAAGLMCVHHEMLPLFGGGAPDTWACIWAIGVASTVSTLRLVADEHWASDVLLGAGVGWLYGYYLPKLLHFHTKKVASSMTSRGATPVTWMPTFMGTTESGMAGVMGTF
ncbi:MAG: hypothetical protein JWP87_2042 [Labilithrix sp.]|nr:hypothetical protein [Labilithrix sp.]